MKIQKGNSNHFTIFNTIRDNLYILNVPNWNTGFRSWPLYIDIENNIVHIHDVIFGGFERGTSSINYVNGEFVQELQNFFNLDESIILYIYSEYDKQYDMQQNKDFYKQHISVYGYDFINETYDFHVKKVEKDFIYKPFVIKDKSFYIQEDF